MARSRSTSSQLARLFDQSPDPIYVVDERRTIVFCNAACAAWTRMAIDRLVGCRVEYVAGDEAVGARGVAAGLCPPPAAFAGEETAGHVTCMSPERSLLHRRARFLPLGRGALECLGVAVFVSGADLSPGELEADTSGAADAGALHLAIRRFRASQRERYSLAHLIGQHPALRKAREQVALAAASRASVLVVGPEGSGRLHVANTVHYQSSTKQPVNLIPLECALADADLIRSTLDALTRPDLNDEPGALLLVDVDCLSGDAQAYLIETLSRSKRRPRLLGTANCSLIELAGKDAYRLDLSHALSTIEIRLPPLSARLEDLPLLSQVFLEECNRENEKQIGGVSSEAMTLLARHTWPRNLDELAETIRSAHRAADGHLIETPHLPSRIHRAAAAAGTVQRSEEKLVLEDLLEEIETELIRRALDRAGGNKTKAAELVGMNRAKFYRRLEQLHLSRPPQDANG